MDDLHQLLVSAGLARVADVITHEARPSIRIRATAVESEDLLPVGASKIGGSPDFPPEFDWPLHGGFPLAFVAQIRLNDVTPFDGEGVPPETGILYFFYDYDYIFRGREEWHADSKRYLFDPENWRVLFYGGDPALLMRTLVPPAIYTQDTTGRYLPCTIAYGRSTTVPDVFAVQERFSLSAEEWEAYFGIEERLRGTSGDSCSRMLGFPDEIQHDFERLREGEVLLLQLGSEEDAGMMWGDGGNLYFIISADALAHRDFSAVRFTIESG